MASNLFRHLSEMSVLKELLHVMKVCIRVNKTILLIHYEPRQV